jgi:hypothetical protein
LTVATRASRVPFRPSSNSRSSNNRKASGNPSSNPRAFSSLKANRQGGSVHRQAFSSPRDSRKAGSHSPSSNRRPRPVDGRPRANNRSSNPKGNRNSSGRRSNSRNNPSSPQPLAVGAVLSRNNSRKADNRGRRAAKADVLT